MTTVNRADVHVNLCNCHVKTSNQFLLTVIMKIMRINKMITNLRNTDCSMLKFSWFQSNSSAKGIWLLRVGYKINEYLEDVL